MKKILTTLFSVLFGTSFAFSTLQLNEIRTDHSGFPDNDEMLEIKGTPGEVLQKPRLVNQKNERGPARSCHHAGGGSRGPPSLRPILESG